MKTIIRSEKQKVTDSMKEYTDKKLSKIDKYLESSENITANVLFKLTGPKQKVEITIPLQGYTLRVEVTREDYYAIIDSAIDKLERQIRKNKTRINRRKTKTYDDFTNLDFVEEEENKDKIEKRKKVELKPMDEEEAILQMELSNHDFYVFKNKETGKLAIIYKRKDSGYGLIEEE